MTITAEENERLAWGSHVPLLRAALDVFGPESVIECGGGRYSTPVFLQGHAAQVLTIEHDAAWFEQVKAIAEPYRRPGLTWDIKRLEIPIDTATERRNMSALQADQCDIPYITLARELKRLGHNGNDLLFVDCSSGARCSALKALGKLANVVILHDTQAVNYQHYHYPQGVACLPGDWLRYRYEIPGGQYPATDILFAGNNESIGGEMDQELFPRHVEWCGHENMTFELVERIHNHY